MRYVDIVQMNRPCDEDINILHLGSYPNMDRTPLSEDDVARYQAATGRQFPEHGVLYVGDSETEEEE